MNETFDPTTISNTLRSALTGGEPPSDLLNQLGGWSALETLAPHLADDPLLTPAVSLLARDASIESESGEGVTGIRPVAAALAKAVAQTRDPLQFAQGIDTFCATPILVELVGALLAEDCLNLATPPTSEGDEPTPSEAEVVRHATALEGFTRLAVQGQASKYKLLGLLEDIGEPQPRRYAQAVVRAISFAFDHWTPEGNLAEVIDILTGVKPPAHAAAPEAALLARNVEYQQDIASDAMWAKANVDVALALRASTPTEVVSRLDDAMAALDVVSALDDRDDVELMRAALLLLRTLLNSLKPGGHQDASDWALTAADVENLTQRAAALTFTTFGLNHWSGDRKVAVFQGWTRLARDLAWLRAQLERDSLYEAAVVLDDIMTIYSATTAYEITRNTHGIENVMAVIRPAITGGFASRIGLLRHLTDHVESLRGRIETDTEAGEDVTALQAKIATAEAVLTAARATVQTSQEPPGKPGRQAPLPPLLAELLESHPTVTEALADIATADLASLASDLADLQAATDIDPDPTRTAVRKRILEELATCKDFTGDVVPAVTRVLDQLIAFVARRMNTQESSKHYLFKDDADEHDLHVDLYDWLCQGQLASATNVEVQEVGAGRVDIQINFSGFHLYLELKADETHVPVTSKAAYIKQTVSYQASDVRIGFLVVLRIKPPKDKSPSPHLSENVTHTTVQIKENTTERHVVMLEVPGNQTKPSSVK